MLELGQLLRDLWGAWLMLIFLGIVVWAYWPGRRRRRQMRDHADIPFRNDDPPAGGRKGEDS